MIGHHATNSVIQNVFFDFDFKENNKFDVSYFDKHVVFERSNDRIDLLMESAKYYIKGNKLYKTLQANNNPNTEDTSSEKDDVCLLNITETTHYHNIMGLCLCALKSHKNLEELSYYYKKIDNSILEILGVHGGSDYYATFEDVTIEKRDDLHSRVHRFSIKYKSETFECWYFEEADYTMSDTLNLLSLSHNNNIYSFYGSKAQYNNEKLSLRNDNVCIADILSFMLKSPINGKCKIPKEEISIYIPRFDLKNDCFQNNMMSLTELNVPNEVVFNGLECNWMSDEYMIIMTKSRIFVNGTEICGYLNLNLNLSLSLANVKQILSEYDGADAYTEMEKLSEQKQQNTNKNASNEVIYDKDESVNIEVINENTDNQYTISKDSAASITKTSWSLKDFFVIFMVIVLIVVIFILTDHTIPKEQDL